MTIHSLFTDCFGEAVILNPKLTASSDFESKHHSCELLNSHWSKFEIYSDFESKHHSCGMLNSHWSTLEIDFDFESKH